MKKQKIFLISAFVPVLLLLAACTPAASQKTGGAPSAFAADSLGVYYITQEKTICFIPFSEEKALGYGHEAGIVGGLSDITAICAEGDGHIGAVDSTGAYHTTCGVQPEQAEEFIPDGENIGAGYGQLASTARGFAGLSEVSFFRSAYPIWGLFVHRDGSVTIPGADEEAQNRYAGWKNVTQLAGSQDVAALTAEGTVLCMPNSPYKGAYESWRDISALYSDYATGVFAVTKQGDVLFAGENHWGEGDIGAWHDIVSIAAAPSFTAGLQADGTVVAAGQNDCGQCDVADWTNIIAIAASSSVGSDGATTYTAGLDCFGNIWIAGKIRGAAHNGLYAEGAAQDFLEIEGMA